MIKEVGSTQEKALNGLIDLWADVYSTERYFIQGKSFKAGQLKPHVKAALAEPDSSILKVIEAEPEKAAACIEYGSIPMRVRRNTIIQNLIRKELRDNEFLYFFDGAFYLAAVLHISFGITFAEAEKRMKQSFGLILSRMTLKQLLSEPSENDIPSEFRLHTWLSSLPLSAGSIAGANVRLRRVLEQRFKIFSGDTRHYEQDLKIALLDCWNGSHVDACVKLLRDQGDTTQQMATFKRILDGQEPKLLRTMLLAMLRKTIEEETDIADEIKERRRQEEYLANLNKQRRKDDEPLSGFIVRDESVLENIEAKEDRLTEKLTYEGAIELLRHEGINKDDLTEKDWRCIFQLTDAVNEGAEIASKKGLSLNAYFGDDSAATRKQLSRLRKRITELKANRPQG